MNEDITEAEEEIAAEEEEAKTAAADDEIEKLQAENRQLKEEFLRAYADAENTKKRCAQEIEKNNKYAISSFAKDLLTVPSTPSAKTIPKTAKRCVKVLN